MIYFRINELCPEFYILDTSQIWVNNEETNTPARFLYLRLMTRWDYHM